MGFLAHGLWAFISRFFVLARAFKKALGVWVRFESRFVCVDRYLVEVEMKEGGDTEEV